MTKSPAQLDREIQDALGLPPAILKKWRTKVAAYKKAIARVAAGETTDTTTAAKARDALDKMIYEAAGHVPYAAGKPAHLAMPILALEAERKALVDSTWYQAQEKGSAARYASNRAEAKRLDEEIREAKRPYDWMKR